MYAGLYCHMGGRPLKGLGLVFEEATTRSATQFNPLRTVHQDAWLFTCEAR